MDLLDAENLQTIITEMANNLRTRTDLSDEVRYETMRTVNQLIKLKAVIMKQKK